MKQQRWSQSDTPKQSGVSTLERIQVEDHGKSKRERTPLTSKTVILEAPLSQASPCGDAPGTADLVFMDALLLMRVGPAGKPTSLGGPRWMKEYLDSGEHIQI